MANEIEQVKNLQTQGYTPGIVDRIFMEIAGFQIPGVIESFDIPDVEPETIDTESGMQTRIPTLIYKPVIASFRQLIMHPAVGALLVRSPAIRLSSKKSRLSLVTQRATYEDGVEIMGTWIKSTREKQRFKAIDGADIEISVHTFQHKYGDGTDTFECAFYKTQPPQLRIQYKEFVGGIENNTLIKW